MILFEVYNKRTHKWVHSGRLYCNPSNSGIICFGEVKSIDAKEYSFEEFREYAFSLFASKEWMTFIGTQILIPCENVLISYSWIDE